VSTMASRVAFHVKLADNYMALIDQAIEDELKTAQRKWGVELSDETIESVKRHSLNQLSMKVDLTLKTSWNFQPFVTLKIKGLSKNSSSGPLKDLTLPDELKSVPEIALVLGRDGFEVESEPSDGTVDPADLNGYILNRILVWIRTAVFYGVGSYKG